MGIGTVKGVEIGAGFDAGRMAGSTCNDPITPDGFRTNHAGGFAGITSGAEIVIRIACKPIPSIALPQETIDRQGNPVVVTIEGRHDVCVIPRSSRSARRWRPSSWRTTSCARGRSPVEGALKGSHCRGPRSGRVRRRSLELAKNEDNKTDQHIKIGKGGRDSGNFEIGIIGGTGGIGRWFADCFGKAGYRVHVTGRREGISLPELAARCRIVIVSVPIGATPEVIRQVGPLLPEDSLLMDFTSLKEDPLREMLAAARGEVVGCHPLFGPDCPSLEGQNIILCPGRGKSWLTWLEAFSPKGAPASP